MAVVFSTVAVRFDGSTVTLKLVNSTRNTVVVWYPFGVDCTLRCRLITNIMFTDKKTYRASKQCFIK